MADVEPVEQALGHPILRGHLRGLMTGPGPYLFSGQLQQGLRGDLQGQPTQLIQFSVQLPHTPSCAGIKTSGLVPREFFRGYGQGTVDANRIFMGQF